VTGGTFSAGREAKMEGTARQVAVETVVGVGTVSYTHLTLPTKA
jgi:hypothetical protein